MKLDEFLTRSLKVGEANKYSLSEYKNISRDLTAKCWKKDIEYVENVMKNFERFTQLDFKKNEERIMTSLADHYAEQAFVAGDLFRLKKHIDRISIKESLLNDLKAKSKSRNILLITMNWGGVEAIPSTLSLHNLPNAIFVNNINSDSINRKFGNVNELGTRICDVSKGLKSDLIHLRNNPHISMMVYDAFSCWERNINSKTTRVFSQKCKLDSKIDSMVTLLNAEVYFCYMKRNGLETYEFNAELVKSKKDGIIEQVVKRFERLLLHTPTEYSAWNELHGLFSYA